MRALLLSLALVSLVSAPVLLQAKITRNVEKVFTVTPGGELKVETSGGDIKVLSHAGHELKVTAIQQIKVDSDGEADELLKNLQLTIEQSAQGVTATAKYERRAGWGLGSWPPVQVSFVVSVPSHYNVDLNTSGGGIQLESIRGQARLRTSGGRISVDRIEGDLEGKTSGGDISLREGTAAVKLMTSGGNIKVERAGAGCELHTSGGNIVIRSAEGHVVATTSGGDIEAKITGALTEDSKLSTSGGKVVVAVDSRAAFALKASTSGGNVDVTGLSVAIDSGGLRKSSLSGKVNGGGPLLTLKSSGGSIRVRAD